MGFEVKPPGGSSYDGGSGRRYRRDERSAMAFNPGDKPHDLEMERALLAGILLNGEVLLDFGDDISEDDFFLPGHREIFAACRKLAFDNVPIDLQTLAGHLRDHGKIDIVGGVDYLSRLALTPSTSLHAREYAKSVHDLAWRRSIQAAGEKTIAAALKAGDTRLIASEVEQLVFNATQEIKTTKVTKLGDVLPGVIAELERRADNPHAASNLIMSGFRDLDACLAGFRPGQLVVIAARPGMGKTSLAANILHDVAVHQGKGVLFFSLEMTKNEIAERIISFASGVDSARIRNVNLRPDDFQALFEAADELERAPLYIDDRSVITPFDVMQTARRVKSILTARGEEMGLIVCDYIQIMKGGGSAENRSLEVAQITGGLKAIAKEMGVPVIALSQLNRDGSKRGGGPASKPQLSDLRDSGAIEADADIVIFIHREQMEENDSRAPSDAELIVAKNRAGPTKPIRVTWLGHLTRYTDYVDSSHVAEPYGRMSAQLDPSPYAQSQQQPPGPSHGQGSRPQGGGYSQQGGHHQSSGPQSNPGGYGSPPPGDEFDF
ncbi:MAG TPA: replicative DNA helicase [Bdellovibrionota bacterium]|nr:replicative DNA helicase [Bdellovibrionota bacterium]